MLISKKMLLVWTIILGWSVMSPAMLSVAAKKVGSLVVAAAETSGAGTGITGAAGKSVMAVAMDGGAAAPGGRKRGILKRACPVDVVVEPDTADTGPVLDETDMAAIGAALARDRKNAHYRAYYAAHSEQKKAYDAAHKAERKAYAMTHKEQKKACDQAYYAANSKQKKAAQRAYKAAHRKEISDRQREYRAAHKAEIQAAHKAYYDAHKEERQAAQRAYKARKKAEKAAQEALAEAGSAGAADM